MTDEALRASVEAELKHGATALQAARALRDLGLYNDALSRLYYGLFHHVCALLLTQGVEVRKHRALPGLLGLHFVRTGALTAADIACVSRLASYRDLADYERTWDATRAIADGAFADADALVARIKEDVLAQAGGQP